MSHPGEPQNAPEFQRSATADLWRHTLNQIPTVFGRLVYLASLRNPNTGRYEHFGLAQAFGEDESQRVLNQSHIQVFNDWLGFSLEQQMADLNEYLLSEGDRVQVLSTWTRLSPYRTLPPGDVREVERRLYLADLETLLELLKHEHGVVSPDPEA